MTILDPYPQEDIDRLLAAYRYKTVPDLTLEAMIEAVEYDGERNGGGGIGMKRAAQFTQDVERSQGIDPSPIFVQAEE